MYNRKKTGNSAMEMVIAGVIALILTFMLVPDNTALKQEVDESQANTAVEKAMPVQASKAGQLDRIVITVDAGHGGYDSGAVGRKTNILEKDLNLKVTQLLAGLLHEAGATVVLTRDGDYALCPEDTKPGQLKKADMARRAEIIDENYTQILISIHMNEDRSSSSSGPQVFHQIGNTEGKELAEYLQKTLIEQLEPAQKRSVNSGDYFILRHGPPSVLVECGFLSNPNEEILLQDDSYQERLAAAIFQGIVDYCNEHELVPIGPEVPF